MTQALLAAVDWRAVLEPTLPLAEIILRGSIIYLALFLVLRLLARRQAGRFGPADLLVIVLIADAAQNGFGKEYTSVTEAVVLVVTIVVWDYLIDWLAWRFAVLRPILKAPALTLVEHGRPVHRNLRRELISLEELKGQLRAEGALDFAEVEIVTLEGDGRISVVKRNR